MKIVLALIALAFGYKVFVDASKEKEGIKLLGQVIGIFVMIGAVLAFACGVWMYSGHMGYGMKKGYCPFSKGGPAVCVSKLPLNEPGSK